MTFLDVFLWTLVGSGCLLIASFSIGLSAYIAKNLAMAKPGTTKASSFRAVK